MIGRISEIISKIYTNYYTTFITDPKEKKMFSVPRDSRTIRFRRIWGDNFLSDEKWEEQFDKFNKEYVFNFISGYGWKSLFPKIAIGDQLAIHMKSGKIALFKVLKIDHKSDPRDMFIIQKAVFNGYEEIDNEKN